MSRKSRFNLFAFHSPGIECKLPHHFQTFFGGRIAQISFRSLLSECRLPNDLAIGNGHHSILPQLATNCRSNFACPFGPDLPNFAAREPYRMRRLQLIQRFAFFVGRVSCFAVIAGSLSGCAMWDFQKWNPENLRDERARDIDARLSEDRPIVQNPFGSAEN
jgi:hypothetical protein